MVPQSPAKAIFGEAIGLEVGAARTAFLDRACDGNSQLREQIEALLSAWESAGDFLCQPAAAIIGAFPSEFTFDAPGTIIDRYRLLEQIGEGGMGVVYIADQQAPMRRRVALKIIKPGMDTRQVIARFEAERQALALMDHPNIARVLDAGVTESGRPYFVMELVRGIPITEYADQNQLSIAARLQLFVLVCHAVQHAHQNGIIHRDIKPSNVLVTMHDGIGVPKVIDFGVAKATSAPLTDKTLFTNFSHMIGTPSYMSPEQAEMSGLDVDTRSDIYSLGVLLYELLTGSTPFDKARSREASFDEMRRIIRDEEALAPSTFVSTLGQATATLAARRSVETSSLAHVLRGDLDWIVIKALNKDRGRRYPTANGLARDIERHLRNEPIEARPPSGAYRLRKFARRNRAAFITVALVAVALVIGTIASVWQAVRARNAEALAEARRSDAENQSQRADANFQKARRAIDSYVVSLRDHKQLSEVDYQPLRKDLLASTLEYYRQFVEQYRNDPTLQPEIGLAYIRIGQITTDAGTRDQACDLMQQGIDVYQRLCQSFPENQDFQRVLGNALNSLASLLRDCGRPAESVKSSAQAIAIFEKLNRADPDNTENNGGLAHAEFNRFLELRGKGAWAEAEASIRRDLALCEKLFRREPTVSGYRTDLAGGYYHLGLLQRETQRLNEAVDSFKLAAQMFEQLGLELGSLPVHRRAVANAEMNAGDACHILGRNEEAMAAYLSSRIAFQDLADRNPPDASGRTGVGRANFRIAMLEAEAGDRDAAAKSWSRAEADFEVAVRQPNPPISALAGLTAALAMEGKWTSAAAAGVKVVDASGRSCESLIELALLQWAAGDESGYRISCSELVSRFGGRKEDRRATDTIMACIAGEPAVSDTGPILSMAERAVAAEPDDPLRRVLLGVAMWRAGQVQQGLEIVENSLPSCAAAEADAATSHGRVRATHLMAATILVHGLAESGQKQARLPQIAFLRDLVARYEGGPPRFDEETPRWLVGVTLELARRELAAFGPSSALENAAAQ